jgi:hypothetical protein
MLYAIGDAGRTCPWSGMSRPMLAEGRDRIRGAVIACFGGFGACSSQILAQSEKRTGVGRSFWGCASRGLGLRVCMILLQWV